MGSVERTSVDAGLHVGRDDHQPSRGDAGAARSPLPSGRSATVAGMAGHHGAYWIPLDGSAHTGPATTMSLPSLRWGRRVPRTPTPDRLHRAAAAAGRLGPRRAGRRWPKIRREIATALRTAAHGLEHHVEHRHRAGLVEWGVAVAALGRLHARRAAGPALAVDDRRAGGRQPGHEHGMAALGEPCAARVAVVDEDGRRSRCAGGRASTSRRCPTGRRSRTAATARSRRARRRAGRRGCAPRADPRRAARRRRRRTRRRASRASARACPAARSPARRRPACGADRRSPAW